MQKCTSGKGSQQDSGSNVCDSTKLLIAGLECSLEMPAYLHTLLMPPATGCVIQDFVKMPISPTQEDASLRRTCSRANRDIV